MHIPNKTLALFLLVATVISLTGTLISIDRLNDLPPTGFATSDTGNVSINIQSSLSITTADGSLINFGLCTPLGVYGLINSENGSTTNTSQICPSYVGSNITNISVRNDGNVNANVTVRPSNVGAAQGGTFLNSSTLGSALAYKTQPFGRGSNGNGCMNASLLQTNYVNFSSTTSNVTACTNLTYGATNNSFLTQIQIIVPNDVISGQQDVTLTYVAWST